jgi:hypothetical protein
VDGSPPEILQKARRQLKGNAESRMRNDELKSYSTLNFLLIHHSALRPSALLFRPLIFAPGHLNAARKVLSDRLRRGAREGF